MLHRHLLVALVLATAVPALASDDESSHRDFQPTTYYCLVDIGRLPELPVGETFITFNALNIRNQIVGSISIAGANRTLPFIWDRAHGMRNLGELPGHASSNATDINDRGKVVGDVSDPQSGHHLAFIWDKRRGMRVLDASLGGGEHAATGINRAGQVVGASSTRTNVTHAFFRNVDAEVFDLGAFPDGHGESAAFALNDRGTVIGIRTDAQVAEAFIWDQRHGMRLLVQDAGTLVVFPNDINNRNEVVGGLFGETTRAFRWTRATGLEDLGSLSGSETDSVEAFAINRWGTIVGTSQTVGGASHAFIWRRGFAMRDLNDLIDPDSAQAPHIILRGGLAINDIGAIAASGVDVRDSASPERGFLLQPRRHPDSRRCR